MSQPTSTSPAIDVQVPDTERDAFASQDNKFRVPVAQCKFFISFIIYYFIIYFTSTNLVSSLTQGSDGEMEVTDLAIGDL